MPNGTSGEKYCQPVMIKKKKEKKKRLIQCLLARFLNDDAPHNIPIENHILVMYCLKLSGWKASLIHYSMAFYLFGKSCSCRGDDCGFGEITCIISALL